MADRVTGSVENSRAAAALGPLRTDVQSVKRGIVAVFQVEIAIHHSGAEIAANTLRIAQAVNRISDEHVIMQRQRFQVRCTDTEDCRIHVSVSGHNRRHGQNRVVSSHDDKERLFQLLRARIFRDVVRGRDRVRCDRKASGQIEVPPLTTRAVEEPATTNMCIRRTASDVSSSQLLRRW